MTVTMKILQIVRNHKTHIAETLDKLGKKKTQIMKFNSMTSPLQHTDQVHSALLSFADLLLINFSSSCKL